MAPLPHALITVKKNCSMKNSTLLTPVSIDAQRDFLL